MVCLPHRSQLAYTAGMYGSSTGGRSIYLAQPKEQVYDMIPTTQTIKETSNTYSNNIQYGTNTSTNDLSTKSYSTDSVSSSYFNKPNTSKVSMTPVVQYSTGFVAPKRPTQPIEERVEQISIEPPKVAPEKPAAQTYEQLPAYEPIVEEPQPTQEVDEQRQELQSEIKTETAHEQRQNLAELIQSELKEEGETLQLTV